MIKTFFTMKGADKVDIDVPDDKVDKYGNIDPKYLVELEQQGYIYIPLFNI